MKNRAKVLLGLFMGACVLSFSGMNAEAGVMDSEMSCAGISVVFSDYLEDVSALTEATMMPFETTVVGEGTPALANVALSTTSGDAQAADSEQTSDAQPSEYDDVAIAQVSYYVNLRSEPNEESEVVGKLYNNSAATILAQEGDWYKIKSGTVNGYVKSEFVVSGSKAEELAKTVGTRMATVKTQTLKVRDNPSLDSTVLTMVAGGDSYEVLEEDIQDGWVKILVDTDTEGYIASDYVDIKTDFVQAESIEEEQARLQAEEQERLEADEAAKEADEADTTSQNQQVQPTQTPASTVNNTPAKNNNSTANNNTSSVSNTPAPSENKQSQDTKQEEVKQEETKQEEVKQEETKQEEVKQEEANTSNDSSVSGSRQTIVNYALKFVGNPYRYGGTSLTNGTDCSGFTQSVYRDCGIKIPRDSRSQAASGKTISVSNVKPGDLLFYSKGGSINHVAMYIGNGKVVHASTAKTGIKISNYNYRTPCKAVTYIGG